MSKDDHALMEASLIALGDAHDGMAAELFERYIAAHPHYAPVFIHPEAAQERMTRETLEAMMGQAAGEWWVESTVINFVDLHNNYADFTSEDYREWFDLTIDTMAKRTGNDWPKGASAAWQRQANRLVEMITRIGRVPLSGLQLAHTQQQIERKAHRDSGDDTE